jgi:type IX secretion system PorP/SprF family membrane protein
MESRSIKKETFICSDSLEKNKNILVFNAILAFQLFFFSMNSQDVHFSQFYMTPLLLNPAQAGADQNIRGILNYRNQWGSVTQPYSTANFSGDILVNNKANGFFSGVGLNINQDNSGSPALRTLQLGLSYAGHVHINPKSSIGGGLYVGMIQRSISYAGIQWMNQYDGTKYNSSLASGEPNAGTSLSTIDAGAGIHYQYSKSERYMTGNDHRKFNAGISVMHLNRPSYSFYGTSEKVYMKLTAYMNAEIGVGNSDLSLVPGIIVFQQGPAMEILAGNLFQFKLKDDSKYTGYVQGSSFSIGGYYRNADAVVAAMLFKWSQYAIGASYDFNISGLTTASKGRGGFEISFRYVSRSPFLYKNTARL